MRLLAKLIENEISYKSGVCIQRRPRSDCAFAQSDLGLRCMHTSSVYRIIEASISTTSKGPDEVARRRR